jgi:hypothetical protein
MRDLGEYLQAYRGYLLANVGWRKSLSALAWLASMFMPLWAKKFVQLPYWLAITWMILWAMLGYIFVPMRNVEASPRRKWELGSPRP